MIDTIDLVCASIAKDNSSEWDIILKTADALKCVVEIPWLRGRTIKYSLIFEKNENGSLLVREDPLNKTLPDFCPQRHINPGGYFCLGVNDIDNHLIIDEISSDRWVSRLVLYLKLQEKAKILGEWDSDKEWTHGAAAHHQNNALNAAENLGDFFVKSLNEKIIKTTLFCSKNKMFLAVLFLGHDVQYRINLTSKKVTNLRRPCLCEKKIKNVRRIGRCGTHSEDLYNLGWEHYSMTSEEQKFWERGIELEKKCCGFCVSCKLTK